MIAWVNTNANNSETYQITEFCLLKKLFVTIAKDPAAVNSPSMVISLTPDPESANAVKTPNIIAVAHDSQVIEVNVKFRPFQKLYVIGVDLVFEGTVGMVWERP